MAVWIYGTVTFLSALILHFILWKIRLPKRNHTLELLKIFAGVFVLAVVFSRVILQNYWPKIVLPQDFFSYAELFFLYLSLALAYIASYSALEVDSPSMIMSLEIARVGQRGLTREELSRILTDEILIVYRLNDLIEDGMVCVKDNKYELTLKGRWLAGLFVGLRRLLSAPKGG